MPDTRHPAQRWQSPLDRLVPAELRGDPVTRRRALLAFGLITFNLMVGAVLVVLVAFMNDPSQRTEEANQKLRKLKSDIILVAHGAAMESPADAQYILDHTSCEGFWTGSSTERLPIERAVSAAAKEFQALRFPDNR
jgi:type II secretory pathway component PulM